MSDADHEKRISRLEHSLFGTDDNPGHGLIARYMMTEELAKELKSYAVRIVWLLVIAVSTALLNLIISTRLPASAAGASQNTSVITSDAVASDEAQSKRDWLTVQEVAADENVDEHTITNYIARGQILPAPVKAGKSWQIARAYRIIPNAPEPSRTVANRTGE